MAGGLIQRLLALSPGFSSVLSVVPFLLMAAQQPDLCGQTIQGQIVDAGGLRPIPNAEIKVFEGGTLLAQTLSDSLGSFSVQLPHAGTFSLSASALGYAPSDSALVRVDRWSELVEVVIRLSAQPLLIEGLTIVARGLELRHRATIGGFLERHKSALRVGPARVVSKGDPVMRTAGNVGDVLKWFPAEGRGCTVVFMDGRVRLGWGNVESEVVPGLAGIEFYLDYRDAPLEFRGGGPPCSSSTKFSVLALWRDRPGGG